MNEVVRIFEDDFIRWGCEVLAGNRGEERMQKVRDYCDSLKVIGDSGDFLYYVAYFALTNRSVYSVSIVNSVIKTWKGRKDFGEDQLNASRFLLKYLRTVPSFPYGAGTSCDGDGAIKDIVSHFKKPLLTKIDGMDGLLGVLGEDGFIKTVIENTYFFSPELVSSQFGKMVKTIKKGENIPARMSTQNNLYQLKDDKRYFVDGSFKCPIMLDKDGNAEVRKLINQMTGFTISQGKGSVFQNYCISHIWGKAYDPRYFTSLWNIAIIPAWGNSLMDKLADEESDEVERLAAKLKSTMEAVCWSLYKMDELKWNELGMMSSQIKEPLNIVPQEFFVRVLTGDMCISKVLLKLSSN